jgi:cytidine deaminase
MPKTRFSSEERTRLIRAARAASRRAYAPYSRFRVGAALLTAKGELFFGCNVENAAYPVTNCAERTAIFSAVAQSGPGLEILAIAVINQKLAPCSPCGACRQVIYEFGPRARVLFRTSEGWTESSIADLLPYGFRLR